MERTLIFIEDKVWVYSEELRPNWLEISKSELDEALEYLDYHAAINGDKPLPGRYDNYNLGALALDARRFFRYAREVEGW
ncbi:hypothetical protein Rctr85_038 [Virus Rctr85]|nr:hypothetical protein Rctr85_038 [Virus Rctr85]